MPQGEPCVRSCCPCCVAMVPALIPVLSACAALIAGGGAGEAAAGRSAFLPAGEARPAVAVAADLASDGDRTHLVFTLSREVAARVSSMERPDRIIVDLPEVTFYLPAETTRKRAGLVASLRYGLFAPGRSRVVIELAQPA